jgi:hypothetical protein
MGRAEVCAAIRATHPLPWNKVVRGKGPATICTIDAREIVGNRDSNNRRCNKCGIGNLNRLGRSSFRSSFVELQGSVGDKWHHQHQAKAADDGEASRKPFERRIFDGQFMKERLRFFGRVFFQVLRDRLVFQSRNIFSQLVQTRRIVARIPRVPIGQENPANSHGGNSSQENDQPNWRIRRFRHAFDPSRVLTSMRQRTVQRLHGVLSQPTLIFGLHDGPAIGASHGLPQREHVLRDHVGAIWTYQGVKLPASSAIRLRRAKDHSKEH